MTALEREEVLTRIQEMRQNSARMEAEIEKTRAEVNKIIQETKYPPVVVAAFLIAIAGNVLAFLFGLMAG